MVLAQQRHWRANTKPDVGQSEPICSSIGAAEGRPIH
jgi:hypothetical protein